MGACLAVAWLSACGSEHAPTASPSADGDWVLSSGQVDGHPLELSEATPVTLSIDGTDAAGRSACNLYTGLVDIDGDQAAFTGLGSTEMGCSPDVMTVEVAYIAALSAVGTAQRNGDQLTLRGDGIELVFAAVPPVEPATLTGTVWVLESVTAGAGSDGSTSTAIGERATLEFGSDGTVLGSTGCRQLDARYAADGATVELQAVTMSDEDCGPDVAAQDGIVVTVLGGGFTAGAEGDQLTLRDPSGSALVYRAESRD